MRLVYPDARSLRDVGRDKLNENLIILNQFMGAKVCATSAALSTLPVLFIGSSASPSGRAGRATDVNSAQGSGRPHDPGRFAVSAPEAAVV